MVKILVIIGCILIFIVSCSNNQIYYDSKTETIKTQNGKTISNLIIEVEKDSFLYFIEKKPGKKGVKSIDLRSIDTDYMIIYNDMVIDNKSFKLKPNNNYVITNYTYGGATQSTIKLYTDSATIPSFSVILR